LGRSLPDRLADLSQVALNHGKPKTNDSSGITRHCVLAWEACQLSATPPATKIRLAH
jgi:hypothetical protein